MSSAVQRTSSSSKTSLAQLFASDRFLAIFLFVAIIVACAALQPFVELPKNDDFAWARSAEAFAKTGRIIYNGWGNPILLPHTIAGAVVVKVFGFSYAALSFFGVVSGAAMGAAMYLLARKCAIPRLLSVLIVAILTLNPIFLGVAPSFMSDVPTTLLFVAALLAFASALQPVEDQSQSRLELRPVPFITAVTLAFLAGANRQLFWVVFLCAFAAVWKNLTPSSRNRYFMPAMALMSLGAVAASVWFAKQPYSVSLSFRPAILLLKSGQAGLALLYPYKLVNLVGLGLLPLAVPAVIHHITATEKSTRQRFINTLLGCIVLSLLVLGIFYVVPGASEKMRSGLYGIREGGQYLTSQGMQIGTPYGWQFKPFILADWMAHLLYGMGTIGCALVLCLLLPSHLTGRSDTSLSLMTTIIIRAALISSAEQLFLPFPWYAGGSCFERYLLGILPGPLLFCAAQLPKTTTIRYPGLLVSVLLSGIFATHGFLTAAEYFAGLQCKWQLFNLLQQRGIAREQIDAGWEVNGETQILREGHINNPGQTYYDAKRQGNCSSSSYLFPAVDAYLLFSSVPAEKIDISGSFSQNALTVDPKPILMTEYSSPLLPFKRRIYLYRLNKGAHRSQILNIE